MTIDQILKYARISDRQLNYWIQQKYLPGNNPGSGNNRSYTIEQAKTAKLIRRLLECGFALPKAASLANNTLNNAKNVFILQPGIHLYIMLGEEDDGTDGNPKG